MIKYRRGGVPRSAFHSADHSISFQLFVVRKYASSPSSATKKKMLRLRLGCGWVDRHVADPPNGYVRAVSQQGSKAEIGAECSVVTNTLCARAAGPRISFVGLKGRCEASGVKHAGDCVWVLP